MKKRIWIPFIALLIGMAGINRHAEAHDSFGLSINLGGPPVVYSPPPAVYYAPPPAVYYRPVPVYSAPGAYFRFNNYDGWHDRPRHDRGRDWHHRWHRD